MITVFTPTYNRSKELVYLYKSLISQSFYDFEWLIVDDGSKDDTQQVVSGFIKENKIKIRYFFQNNQGKFSALNFGIDSAEGDYFICVDSDDFLSDDALSCVREACSLMDNKTIGCVFPQTLFYDIYRDNWERIDKNKVDIIDLKEIYNIVESAIVMRTNVIKEYRLPKFIDDNGNTERFCSEGLLYNRLIEEGKFLAINKVIYISNYLANGLTRNLFKKVWIENFNSTIADFRLRFNVASKYSLILRVKVRIKAILNLNALCMIKNKSVLKNTPSLFYSIILYLPGFLFKFYRFK